MSRHQRPVGDLDLATGEDASLDDADTLGSTGGDDLPIDHAIDIDTLDEAHAASLGEVVSDIGTSDADGSARD